MYTYIYNRDGQTFWSVYPTAGQAIDAAMMDFSSGMTDPVKVQLPNYNDMLDYHDLHWLYSRTWNAEYDRASGAVTARG